MGFYLALGKVPLGKNTIEKFFYDQKEKKKTS